MREITSRGETVFDYVSKSHQVFGCERLANGNTLVAEQEPCQAVEVKESVDNRKSVTSLLATTATRLVTRCL